MPKGSRAASANTGSRLVRQEQARMKESINNRKAVEHRREMAWAATTVFQELADWSGGLHYNDWHDKVNHGSSSSLGDLTAVSEEEFSFSGTDDFDGLWSGGGGGGGHYGHHPCNAGYFMDEGLLREFIERTFGIGRFYSGKPKELLTVGSDDGSSTDGSTATSSSRSSRISWNECAFRMAQAAAYEKSLGHCDKGKLTLDAAVVALDSYLEYLKQRKLVEKVFRTYNRARDERLKRSELLVALQDRERRADRSPNGVIILLLISPKDMDIIMEEATFYRRTHPDHNKKSSNRTTSSHSGKKIKSITRSELLPAIQVWERLAQKKLYGNQMGVGVGCYPSSGDGCIIL